MAIWRQVVRQIMAQVLPRHLFMVAGPRRSREVALTFDDGPDPNYTPKLLDLLAEHQVRATFFVIGQNAERHPELVRRIAFEGHALGHHTFYHMVPDKIGAQQLIGEVCQTDRVLKTIVGQSSQLFRPPFGKITLSKIIALWRARRGVVLWNRDSGDYYCDSPDEVRARFESRPLRGGDLVLLHDDRPHAADVLAQVIKSARSRGLTFITVHEWIRRLRSEGAFVKSTPREQQGQPAIPLARE
jgi:peptidoglycan-N-acetylglucosamine deacetylase